MAHVLNQLCYFGLAMTIKRVRKATYYVNDKCVVKMTANHPPRRGKPSRVYFSVTVGSPNYEERQFIKDCKKAGVKLPTKKGPLFKYWPEKKRKSRA